MKLQDIQEDVKSAMKLIGKGVVSCDTTPFSAGVSDSHCPFPVPAGLIPTMALCT